MKKNLKSLIALMLVLAMCFTLAACGKADNGAVSGGDRTADTGEHPDFVYVSQYEELFKTADGVYITAKSYTDKGFYGAESRVTRDITPPGERAAYEGQYDVSQEFLIFAGFDGRIREFENFAPIEIPDIPEGAREPGAGTDICAAFPRDDGSIVILEESYVNWIAAPEGMSSDDMDYYSFYEYEQRYFVRTLDSTGAELSSGEIEVPKDSYIDAYRAQMTKDGDIIFPSDSLLVCVNTDGETQFTVMMENYIDSMLTLPDGSVAVLCWGDNGEELRLLDTVKQTLGEAVSLPGEAYSCIPGGGEYDLYYTGGVSFYGFKLKEQTSEKLFSWLDCDVNNDELGGTYVSSEGEVIGILREWDDDYTDCTFGKVTVTRQPWDKVPHKQDITLATLYLDWNVRDTIIDFNRTNERYRIRVKDYSEYNSNINWEEHEGENYNPGLDKLNTEIMAGNMPDILCLSGMNYTQLAAKGLLVDLYPYMDADPDIDRNDFFENVLSALEVNGKLYTTVSSFSIDTAMGAASVVGDEPGWNYDEFNAVLQTMPEGCTAFDRYVTRGSILSTCLYLDMTNFVNWSTGECSFNTPEFIQLLQFAKSFPSEFDWDSYDYEGDDNTEKRIREGRQMLLQTGIYSVDSLMWDNYGSLFGGDVCYIGYPCAYGVGSRMNIESGYAISASSPNKDAAWQFLRTFCTEDYLKNTWGLPVSEKLFEQQIKKAMTVEYEKDRNGNYLLDQNGEKIPVTKGGYNDSEGKWVEVYAMTEKQADQIREVIKSTTKFSDYNSGIFDIITEEAAAFFEGQKSAEEVAKLIQSKANIFVNEQR